MGIRRGGQLVRRPFLLRQQIGNAQLGGDIQRLCVPLAGDHLQYRDMRCRVRFHFRHEVAPLHEIWVRPVVVRSRGDAKKRGGPDGARSVVVAARAATVRPRSD
ncbi:hypothetical protein [Burkholderia mayonis]|uniref:hypothetical protein n=1 Tax=Burkholderia mayonis TaxID=1385591 RepID=UPI001CF7B37F|nr:hypothetical protein [Burkholderia mayonis]